MEEYTVISKYRGIPPICECGYCNETPNYHRGSFTKYYKSHGRYEWLVENYILKNGHPTCEVCGESVDFYRGVPRKVCSNGCAGKYNTNNLKGFSNPVVQSKIRSNIIAKYGVDNVSKLDSVKSKISISNIGRVVSVSDATKEKMSIASHIKWSDPEYKRITSAKIKEAVNLPCERERRRLYIINRIERDPSYLAELINRISNGGRCSMLHLHIRAILGLDRFGFESEQCIDRYIVDELNKSTKTIIEINGDYVHANPKIFDKDHTIRLSNMTYTAEQKWNYDHIRKCKLNSLGYDVITIWESDLIEDETLSKFKPMLENGGLDGRL